MVGVSAGPGGEDFDATASPPIFCCISSHQQLELAEGFGRGRVEDRTTRLRDNVAGSVDQLLPRAPGRSGDAGLGGVVHARHVAEKR
jgi:hypothetical protein